MDYDTFQELLIRIKPLIERKNTLFREAVSAEERLLATLRFLATGKSYEDLTFSSIISPQLLGQIIPETCRAIYNSLRKEYLRVSIVTSFFMYKNTLIIIVIIKLYLNNTLLFNICNNERM